MRLIRPNGPESSKRIYRARVDCIWLNGEVETAKVVMDEYAIVSRRGDTVKLDRPCSATNGMETTDIATLEREFRVKPSEAIMHLYSKLHASIDSAIENEDVIAGRIKEEAAILTGLN